MVKGPLMGKEFIWNMIFSLQKVFMIPSPLMVKCQSCTKAYVQVLHANNTHRGLRNCHNLCARLCKKKHVGLTVLTLNAFKPHTFLRTRFWNSMFGMAMSASTSPNGVGHARVNLDSDIRTSFPWIVPLKLFNMEHEKKPGKGDPLRFGESLVGFVYGIFGINISSLTGLWKWFSQSVSGVSAFEGFSLSKLNDNHSRSTLFIQRYVITTVSKQYSLKAKIITTAFQLSRLWSLKVIVTQRHYQSLKVSHSKFMNPPR